MRASLTRYYEAFRRTLYLHEGGRLFSTQVIQLPVLGIDRARAGLNERREERKTIQLFKDPPPGIAGIQKERQLVLTELIQDSSRDIE
jgi:hypothetical protein